MEKLKELWLKPWFKVAIIIVAIALSYSLGPIGIIAGLGLVSWILYLIIKKESLKTQYKSKTKLLGLFGILLFIAGVAGTSTPSNSNHSKNSPKVSATHEKPILLTIPDSVVANSSCEVVITGKTVPNAQVQITDGYNLDESSVKSSKDGSFSLKYKIGKANYEETLTITAKSKKGHATQDIVVKQNPDVLKQAKAETEASEAKAKADKAAKEKAKAKADADAKARLLIEQKGVETTADQLVEKTNDGSLKSGEKYHFVGEMMRADEWHTGGSGKFTVYVKAPSQSPLAGMMLYADESAADNWTDGTQVDFTVDIENINVNGEQITNPVVKSSKIISGGTSKEAKETAKENDFYSAMSSAAQTVNNSLGSTAIDSIDKGYIYPDVDVQLNIIFASYTNMEIKSLVQTLNENLVKVALDKGETNPRISYYISGVPIGENRSILNPSEVKFNSNLN